MIRQILTSLPIVIALAPASWAQPVSQDCSGVVVGPEGQPVADVFIQQAGSLACAVTDPRGSFRLRLDATGKAAVVVSAPGFQTREVPLAEAARIQLAAMPTYRPVSPVPVGSDTAVAPVAPRPLFGDRIAFTTRARHIQQNTTLSDGVTRSLSGWAMPEAGADLRLSLGDVFLVAEASRFKASANLAGLTTQPATQPAIEWSEYNLGAAWPICLLGVETLGLVGISNQYVSPTMANMGLTGTIHDHSQTRSGLLLGIEGGHRHADWTLTGSFRFVPLSLFTSPTAPVTVDGLRWAQLGVSASRPISRELDVELTLARQFGSAGTVLGEAATSMGAGLVYRPGRGTP